MAIRTMSLGEALENLLVFIQAHFFKSLFEVFVDFWITGKAESQLPKLFTLSVVLSSCEESTTFSK